jgi:hypothetical protein
MDVEYYTYDSSVFVEAISAIGEALNGVAGVRLRTGIPAYGGVDHRLNAIKEHSKIVVTYIKKLQEYQKKYIRTFHEHETGNEHMRESVSMIKARVLYHEVLYPMRQVVGALRSYVKNTDPFDVFIKRVDDAQEMYHSANELRMISDKYIVDENKYSSWKNVEDWVKEGSYAWFVENEKRRFDYQPFKSVGLENELRSISEYARQRFTYILALDMRDDPKHHALDEHPSMEILRAMCE